LRRRSQAAWRGPRAAGPRPPGYAGAPRARRLQGASLHAQPPGCKARWSFRWSRRPLAGALGSCGRCGPGVRAAAKRQGLVSSLSRPAQTETGLSTACVASGVGRKGEQGARMGRPRRRNRGCATGPPQACTGRVRRAARGARTRSLLLPRHQRDRLRRCSQCASVLAPIADSSSGSVSSSRAHSLLAPPRPAPPSPAAGGSPPASAPARHCHRCAPRLPRCCAPRRRCRSASRTQPPGAIAPAARLALGGQGCSTLCIARPTCQHRLREHVHSQCQPHACPPEVDAGLASAGRIGPSQTLLPLQVLEQALGCRAAPPRAARRWFRYAQRGLAST